MLAWRQSEDEAGLHMHVERVHPHAPRHLAEALGRVFGHGGGSVVGDGVGRC